MRKLLYLFLLVLFFISHTSHLFAQGTTPAATPGTSSNIPSGESSSGANDFDDFVLDPPQFPQDPKNPEDSNYITDFTPEVKVTFPGLEGTDYKVCLGTHYCVKDVSFAYAKAEEKISILSQVGIDGDEFSDLKDYEDVFDGNTITVCGDGKYNLKADKDDGCKDDRDYFHAGNVYLITIYADQSDRRVAVARAGFYVSHGVPTITLLPVENLTPTGQKFNLTLTQPLRKPGGDNRNNYQVVLEGPGYKNEECSTFKSTSEPATFNFPANDDSDELKTNGFRIPGTYLFKINEQNNEKGGLRQVGDGCQGGFTFMHVTCTIGTDNKRNNCRRVVDPKGEDGKELLNLLNIINGSGEQGVDLPCNKDKKFVRNPLECDSIDTSIGPIAVDPIGFITRIFSIVLSIAGLGAMILIIYSGYRLLISRGDKEKIQGARETITAAVVGLLFIAFSLVILSVIAGDILKIPGFS